MNRILNGAYYTVFLCGIALVVYMFLSLIGCAYFTSSIEPRDPAPIPVENLKHVGDPPVMIIRSTFEGTAPFCIEFKPFTGSPHAQPSDVISCVTTDEIRLLARRIGRRVDQAQALKEALKDCPVIPYDPLLGPCIVEGTITSGKPFEKSDTGSGHWIVKNCIETISGDCRK